jgi:hypothetical protein
VYLHLGQNVVVPSGSVIGIFDMDNATWSHITRGYLNNAEKSGNVITIVDDIPRSFIVCNEEDKTKIYLSQLASATLMKRGELIING